MTTNVWVEQVSRALSSIESSGLDLYVSDALRKAQNVPYREQIPNDEQRDLKTRDTCVTRYPNIRCNVFLILILNCE